MMNTQGIAIDRQKLWIIVGLIAVSTLLFVIGVTLERQSESNESAESHVEGEVTHEESAGSIEEDEHTEEGSESEEVHAEEGEQNEVTHEESEEAHEEGETVVESSEEENHSEETILGVDIESPWLIALAVGGWIVLTLALLRFGYPVLFLIIISAVVMGVFDVVEVSHQLDGENATIAAIAALVAILHFILALIAAWVLWGKYSKLTTA
ncbi:MAG: hypothetical protein K8I82_30620 [Anaerolineae bacterium]|nr:hypothetical protein [Anaerolineae bacterium]